MVITERIEDYMETVLEIELEGGVPSVTELAMRLGVRKATVVVAVRKMVSLGLLDHQRYGKIELTREGREKALETYRRHQHMTFLFSEILGLDDGVAEEMACAVEHSLNPESERRLSAFVDFCCKARSQEQPWVEAMNRFVMDPEHLSIPLSMLLPREEARILRLTVGGEQRQKLKERGFVPEASIRRVDDGRDREVEVEVNGQKQVLSSLEALSVWVVSRESE